MVEKEKMRVIIIVALLLCFGSVRAQNTPSLPQKFAQLMYGPKKQVRNSHLLGHSHNDYKQPIPFLSAYYAGMESIEADVFLKSGALYVAHEANEIREGRTLQALYLEPLFKLFRQHPGYPFADTSKRLQLVIDIKENHQAVIPALINSLKPYMEMIAATAQSPAVRIVLSGDMPAPDHYHDYPAFISFDGRPGMTYTADELQRVAMISNSMDAYTNWNGKGRLGEAAKDTMQKVVDEARRLGKPFRFWATPDSKNAWTELEKLGVSWINTDHPGALGEWLSSLADRQYSLASPLPVYQPRYAADGTTAPVKNVLLLIGDGMGLAQIKAALSANHGQLNMAQFHSIGFSRTESANAANTDSGAGGSAIATGVAHKNEHISVDSTDRPLPKLPDILFQRGMASAILSTGDVTDATPAVFYASNPDRNASEAIARDFLKSPVSILGGTMPGFFRDVEKRKAYEKQLQERGKTTFLLPDSATRPVKDGRGPILAEMLKKSLDQLSVSGKGFFIMAEGAQIDYGGHANDLPYVVTETLDFDQAVGEALRFADQHAGTLVIVTADHETGGLSLLDDDEQKGYVRGDFSTNDHTNIPVPVMAYGPCSQMFRGFYKNTEIFHKILEAVFAN